MSGPPLLDARGCLSEAAFEALSASPPGRAPAEVVAHLGKCERCQGRVLARAAGRSESAPGRTRKAPPPLWRTVLVLVVLLLMAVTFVFLVRQLGPSR